MPQNYCKEQVQAVKEYCNSFIFTMIIFRVQIKFRFSLPPLIMSRMLERQSFRCARLRSLRRGYKLLFAQECK